MAPEPEPRSLQASLPSFPHSETWPESPLPDAGADCATATFLPGDKSIVTVTITSESDLEPYCLRKASAISILGLVGNGPFRQYRFHAGKKSQAQTKNPNWPLLFLHRSISGKLDGDTTMTDQAFSSWQLSRKHRKRHGAATLQENMANCQLPAILSHEIFWNNILGPN